MSDDPDEIYEFCMVMTTVEAWVLKEMAAERKRAIEREKRKAKHG
ncbi:hypothetical protein SHOU24_61 [Vibrio phage SHOU24]|nr:hypothetical protein SHOU24_61 [Vibrio phage SHOU24]AHI61258.1 hypothetical protein SHOU24_61 [Vibrio phage SHOU24]